MPLELPPELLSALPNLICTSIGGAIGLGSAVIAGRYAAKNAKEDRDTRSRQEYVSARYEEKTKRYTDFLNAYTRFLAPGRIKDPISPQALDALLNFSIAYSTVRLVASPEVRAAAEELIDVATAFVQGTNSGEDIPSHFRTLTAAMRSDLDALQALLPGYVTP